MSPDTGPDPGLTSAAILALLVLSAVLAAARAALEDLMLNGKYEPMSDFAKHHFALGRAEGEARGEARSVLAVLDARGLVVDSPPARGSSPAPTSRRSTAGCAAR